MIDVLLLFRPCIIRSFKQTNTINYTDMFANYVKIALRILIRNKAGDVFDCDHFSTGFFYSDRLAVVV